MKYIFYILIVISEHFFLWSTIQINPPGSLFISSQEMKAVAQTCSVTSYASP